MKITLHNQEFTAAWLCNLTQRQVSRVDNGRMISCGLMLGDDVSLSTLKRWVKQGIASPLDPDKARHSGCQSKCILRGDSLCQW